MGLAASSADGQAGRIAAIVVLATLMAGRASAQNWSFDARQIALGSPGAGSNLTSTMIADAQHDQSMVLPFGLIQLFRDFDKLNPSSKEFDLLRSLEYTAAPLHFTFGRDQSSSGSAFVLDVRRAALNRNLQQYAGFAPANQPRAAGLAFPTWGRRLELSRDARGNFQGLFIGVGPYLSMQTDLAVDPQLIDAFAASGAPLIPNARLRAGSGIGGEMAVAFIGGYRGRFSLPASTSDRDGLYVAVNYDFLRGLRYEDMGVGLRLDTDASGLLAVVPAIPAPLQIVRTHATSGTGHAVDLGTAVVTNRWEFGFGANGVHNQIHWTGVKQTTYSLANLISGNSHFSESVPVPQGDARVALPIDYWTNVAYNTDRWSAITEVGRGLGGNSFHAGYEYRFPTIELRAGGMYTRQLWNPSAGFGVNLSSRTALDVGIYGNAANVERKRRPAVAVSMRFRAG